MNKNKANSNLFYGAIYDATSFEASIEAYEYAPSRCLCWGDTQSISM
jgi:hypothetical protein